jgi:hypothetical protein
MIVHRNVCTVREYNPRPLRASSKSAIITLSMYLRKNVSKLRFNHTQGQTTESDFVLYYVTIRYLMNAGLYLYITKPPKPQADASNINNVSTVKPSQQI